MFRVEISCIVANSWLAVKLQWLCAVPDELLDSGSIAVGLWKEAVRWVPGAAMWLPMKHAELCPAVPRGDLLLLPSCSTSSNVFYFCQGFGCGAWWGQEDCHLRFSLTLCLVHHQMSLLSSAFFSVLPRPYTTEK